MGYINGKNVIMVRIPTYLDLDTVYPVGSVYISVNSTSPASLFGGTWTQIKDTFLLSAGDTYSNGATGGEATHTLTTNEMPSHQHNASQSYKNIESGTSGEGASSWLLGAGRYNANVSGSDIKTSSVGSGQAHNNMPPYIKVAIWKRTA